MLHATDKLTLLHCLAAGADVAEAKKTIDEAFAEFAARCAGVEYSFSREESRQACCLDFPDIKQVPHPNPDTPQVPRGHRRRRRVGARVRIVCFSSSLCRTLSGRPRATTAS
mmetsp:Transcript_12076/g.48606  ORF Transcript_12076/g.48606 Transcript_12076/m.48606 type:complete len:112 (+) Transcript_12076:1073-1408(+)